MWLPLDADLIMDNGEVVGTANTTGHMILLDIRFEVPYGSGKYYHS